MWVLKSVEEKYRLRRGWEYVCGELPCGSLAGPGIDSLKPAPDRGGEKHVQRP